MRLSIRPAAIDPKIRRWLKLIGYPLAYLAALVFFAYLSFPYDRLKQRIILGFNAAQVKEPNPSRIEIEDLSWSWRFPGVSASGLRIIGPQPEAPKKAGAAPSKRSVVTVDDAYATVSVLSYLVGTTKVSFGVSGFGGEVEGYVKSSTAQRSLEIEFDEVDPAQLPMVTESIGLPLLGELSGTIALMLPEGKISKADGVLDITIEQLILGDGQAKVLDTIALPKVEAGTLELKATVKNGRLKIEEFSAEGPDLEVSADGKLRLTDKLENSLADLYLSFRFTDRYRKKDDTTKALLGDGQMPGLLDMNPKAKRAKQKDGTYNWRVSGQLKRLSYYASTRGAKSEGSNPAAVRKTPPRPTMPRGRTPAKVPPATTPPATAPPAPAAEEPEDLDDETMEEEAEPEATAAPAAPSAAPAGAGAPTQ